MCCSRSFRQIPEISGNNQTTNQTAIKKQTEQREEKENSFICPDDRPHTAEELRIMKEELDSLRSKEETLLKKIQKAQEAIRKDLEQKRTATLAIAAMEDEAWVFEKSANGWI